MKKVVILAMLLVGISAMAQPSQRERRNRMQDLTPEQIATLQTKKATLALDLTAAQQTKMKAIYIEKATIRKAKMEDRMKRKEGDESKQLSTEERYAIANERLDQQIAHKAEVKKILSEEQYQKWQKMQHHRGKKAKGKRERRKGSKSKHERR